MESQLLHQKRFGWITEGAGNGPDPLCDLPVAVTETAVALPTIGSIVPNWLLVVPRTCALSLAELPTADRTSVREFAKELSLCLGSERDAIYFEHGPALSGGVIGCGVDQAHMHVLNTQLSLTEAVLADSDVTWKSTANEDPWVDVKKREYYFIASRVGAFIGFPKRPTSQFFRKHLAVLAGVPSQWDYNCWPNYRNIRRTYERFRRSTTEGAPGE